MKIQTKLTASILSLAVMIAGISAYGFWETSKLGTALYEIGVLHLPAIEAIDRIQNGLSVMDDTLDDIQPERMDLSMIGVEASQQEKALQMIREGLEQAEGIPWNSTNRELWREFHALCDEYKREQCRTIALAAKAVSRKDKSAMADYRAQKDRMSALGAKTQIELGKIKEIQIRGATRARNETIGHLGDLRYFQYFMTGCSILCVLTGVIGGVLAARKISKPITRMTTAMEQIGAGDLGVRVPVNTGDEIGQMAAALNRMVESMQKNEARLDNICDNLPNSMVYQVTYDESGKARFLFVSKAVEVIHHLTPQEVCRDSACLTDQVVPEDRPLLAAALDRINQGADIFDVTLRVRRPDGIVRVIHIGSTSRRLGDGTQIWDGIETDITQRKEAENELHRTNRALRTLSSLNRVVIQAETEENLFQQACRSIAKNCGYKLVWIGILEQDPAQTLRCRSACGPAAGYAEKLNPSRAENDRHQGPEIRCAHTGQSVVCQNIREDTSLAPWHDLAREYGIQSLYSQPLKIGGVPIGVLTVYADEPHFFGREEIHLLEQLADDLSYGIDTLRGRLAKDQSELNLRQMFEGIPDGIILCDGATRRFIVGNRTVCGMLQYTREEITRLRVDDIHPAEDLPWILRKLQLQMEGREKFTPKVPVKRKDGSVFYANVTGTIIFIANRPHIVGIFHDITEEEEAQRALSTSESRLAGVTRLVGEWIWETGPDWVFSYSSPLAEKILGYQSGELVGKMRLPDLFPENKKAALEKAIANRETHTTSFEWLELELTHKTGRTVLVQFAFESLRDAKNGHTGYRGAVFDITTQKQLEQQLLRSQRIESLGLLASGIAHDLNNALTPVMISLPLLRQHAASPVAARIIETLGKSVQRSADIIRQMLLFARGNGGKTSEIQLPPLLRETQQIVCNTFPKNIQIRVKQPHECWTVTGNATELQQVLTNLCVNARDAMPDGGALSLELRNEQVTEADPAKGSRPGRFVVITVADTGSGIPAEIRDRVFEPFFSTKETGKGTGLGLSTVLHIVKRHGGWVELGDHTGRGTVFRIYLPASESTAPGGERTCPHIPERGKGETILVVDDEQPTREIMGQLLENHGYRVVTAGDGTEAMAEYVQRRNSIHLVLIDMMMPVMDGFSTVRAIRRINPACRIVGMSGVATELHTSKAHAEGLRYFLGKPCESGELLDTIRTALDE